MLPDRVREAFSWMESVVAIPPAHAVPVECELVRRLYVTHEWEHIRPLLADDFAMVNADGARAGIEALKRTNELMAAAYDDLSAEIEAIVADPDQPWVLWVRDRSRGRAKGSGQDLDVRAWTRVLLGDGGANVRQIGPSSVIGRA
jgi:hypothetical protein